MIKRWVIYSNEWGQRQCQSSENSSTVSPPTHFWWTPAITQPTVSFPDITLSLFTIPVPPQLPSTAGYFDKCFSSVLPPIPREYVHTVFPLLSCSLHFPEHSRSRWEQWQLVSLSIPWFPSSDQITPQRRILMPLQLVQIPPDPGQNAILHGTGWFSKGKRCAQLHTSDRCLASFRLKYAEMVPLTTIIHILTFLLFQRTDIQPKRADR